MFSRRSLVSAGVAILLASAAGSAFAQEPSSCFGSKGDQDSAIVTCGNGGTYTIYPDGSLTIDDLIGTRSAAAVGATSPSQIWFVDQDMSYWTITRHADGSITLAQS